MTIREFYESIEGDFDQACSRLINEKLVIRFVLKLPSDPSIQQLHKAVEEGDIQSSFRAVHTLKGVCGNLAFAKLYQAAWNLTEQLREKNQQADTTLLELLDQEYKKTVDAIERFSQSCCL